MNPESINKILNDAKAAINAVADTASLEKIRIHYLGRKGQLSLLLRDLTRLSLDERRRLGPIANRARHELEQLLRQRKQGFSAHHQTIDLSLPGEIVERGHLHPLTRFTRRMIEVWRSLGYDVHEGPELEDQWYNFAGLNMPAEHPARDIHDTFYISDQPNLVLRTHCSTVQLRSVHHTKPPLKFVEIGRAYRHEATDAKHESMFTHCDGIVIDRNLNMAHLVTTLKVFLTRLFPQAAMRIRPGYFPFVEPGIEVDMAWTRQGRREWLEMLGAGMVHPNVLKAMGLKPSEWTGFAFGIGVERLAMLHYDIPDIRLFFSGQPDFSKQF